MKTRKVFMMMTVFSLVMFMFSCANKIEDEEMINGDPVPVRFSSKITGLAVPEGLLQSKAYINEWKTGDVIGISMVEHGEEYFTGAAFNKKYVMGADGFFAAEEGDELFYPGNGNFVDFVAY